MDQSDDDVNIYALVARHAQTAPGKVAIIGAGGSLTYGELLSFADRVCVDLLASGLGPEEPVAVLMNRTVELPCVLLGIWKAGGAYVPFDHEDPPERIAGMLATSRCRFMVGEQALFEKLAPYLNPEQRDGLAFLRTDAIGAVSGGTALPVAPGGSRLAYFLFTSGSTGEPKAVEVEHRNVAALLKSAQELLAFDTSDRYLAVSTIAFDASVTELFLPLTTGASLLLRDKAAILDSRRLVDDIRTFGITVVQTGPAVWSMILARVSEFPRVRIAITHGEAIDTELAARLAACGETVFNLYGPTETTVWATGWALSAEPVIGLSPISAPIGKALAHVLVRVIDDNGNEAATGEKGELWLGGAGVARGYRGANELARERFVNVGNVRYYRTGDVVSRDAHGVLHYFGRNDDQMKIRGVRIEPGEVEAALLLDPRISQAAVTWFQVTPRKKAVVAAVVLKPGAQCEENELHQVLATRLPRSMLPSRYMVVPWLPLSATGKVDRKAIRERTEEKTPSAAPLAVLKDVPEPPFTETEAEIARIWQRLLNCEKLLPKSHFFASGGDSLTAVQMILEVEEAFRVELAANLAFEEPSLQAFARAVDSALTRNPDATAASSFVYQIADGGPGAPVFFCNVYLILARKGYWKVPAPLYAVSYWGRGSGLIKARNIEDLAAKHLAMIRRIRPHGPYGLAGYSLGGLVAFEMAQQLKARGEEVDILFLLDALEPFRIEKDGDVHKVRHQEGWGKRLSLHVSRLAQGPRNGSWLDWFAENTMLPEELRYYSPASWLYYLLVDWHLKRPGRISKIFFPKNRWRAFSFIASRMMKAYVAKPYDGKTIVVTAEDHIQRSDAWRKLLPANTSFHQLPFHHLDLFKEPAMSKWMQVFSDAVSR